MSPGAVRAPRQQCQLDFPRHLELALEREALGDLEEHQQVDENQAEDERERAVRPDRQQHADLEERNTERHLDGSEPPNNWMTPSSAMASATK